MFAFVLAVGGCSNGVDQAVAPLSGYIEVNLIDIASEYSGQLAAIQVKEGQRVNAGERLFDVDDTSARFHAAQARESARASEAQALDLANGSRVTEISAQEAKVHQLEAELALAISNLARNEQLASKGFISPAALTDLRTRRDSATASLNAAQAQLSQLHEGSRPALLASARAQALAAEASANQARHTLTQYQVRAPVTGIVHEQYYHAGEVVTQGRPVLALLDESSWRVRFYAGPARLSRLSASSPVSVQVDGCSSELPARVLRIAAKPEYTPPVLFNNAMRDKLSFMVEAELRPTGQCQLQPGLPVTVKT